jgi:hypothetical protein
LLSILYISSATREFSESDLTALLEQSRAKNARLDITGILLYNDGNIMQLLEGPESAVRNLIKTIYADNRHTGIIQLLDKEISKREFPQWSLEFRKLRSSKFSPVATSVSEPSNGSQPDKHQSHMLLLLGSFGFRPTVGE